MKRIFYAILALFGLMVNQSSGQNLDQSGELIAIVDSTKIYESDLPQEEISQLTFELYKRKYSLLNRELEKRIVEAVAKKKGIDADDFLEKNTGRIEILDEEIEQEWSKLVELMQNGPTFRRLKSKKKEDRLLKILKIKREPDIEFEVLVKNRIKEGLTKRKKYKKQREIIKGLKNRYLVNINLTAPDMSPVIFDDTQRLSKGSQVAPITLVEFSGFESSFCSNATLAIENLQKKYSKQIRVIFKHYPLSSHKNALKAHEASMCADEQGEFWPYHDLLFENQDALGINDLKRYAEELNLDTKQFNQCLDSKKYAENVLEDKMTGEAAGVRGIPTFFINGQLRKGVSDDVERDLEMYILQELNPEIVQEKKQAEFKGILAEFEGGIIIEKDILNGQLYDLEEALYYTKFNALEKVIEKKLIDKVLSAKKQTLEEWYNEEMDIHISEAELNQGLKQFWEYAESNPRLMMFDTDAGLHEIKKLLELPMNGSREAVEDLVVKKINDMIKKKKIAEQKPLLVSRLKEKSVIEIFLSSPEAPKFNIFLEGYPTIGPQDASNTIVVFSDFQCAHCANRRALLNRVLERFFGQIKIVFRHYPAVSRHPQALKAHEASMCADEQGRFWPYHDLLFENQDALGISDLKRYAEELNLDTKQFNQCLDSGRYSTEIMKDVQKAKQLQISSAIFIDNIPRNIRHIDQFVWFLTEGKEGHILPHLRR